MTHFILFRVAAGLLFLASLGHTLGGMLGTARKGPGAGPEADRVMSSMKEVDFTWRGARGNWFAWWLGNGLGVSALLVLGIAVLWVLGGLDAAQVRPVMPVAWAATVSLALLAVLGVRYFAARIGAAFGVIAALTLVATVLSL